MVGRQLPDSRAGQRRAVQEGTLLRGRRRFFNRRRRQHQLRERAGAAVAAPDRRWQPLRTHARRGIAAAGLRESSGRSRNGKRRRPVGKPGGLPPAQWRRALQPGRYAARDRRHLHGVRREMDGDRSGSRTCHEQRAHLEVRHARFFRWREDAPLHALCRGPAVRDGEHDEGARLRDGLRTGSVLELHLPAQRSGQRRPVRTGRQPPCLRRPRQPSTPSARCSVERSSTAWACRCATTGSDLSGSSPHDSGSVSRSRERIVSIRPRRASTIRASWSSPTGSGSRPAFVEISITSTSAATGGRTRARNPRVSSARSSVSCSRRRASSSCTATSDTATTATMPEERRSPSTRRRATRRTESRRSCAHAAVSSACVRSSSRKLQTTVAVWGLTLDSELVFVGDAGTTEAGRPSRRFGVEWANYYSPRPWLTLDADMSWSSARFTDDDPVGSQIPGAVRQVASAGVSISELRRFSGGLRLRYLGPRPIVEDASVQAKRSLLFNAEAGYRVAAGTRLVIDRAQPVRCSGQ